MPLVVFLVEDPKHLGAKFVLKRSRMQAEEKTIGKAEKTLFMPFRTSLPGDAIWLG